MDLETWITNKPVLALKALAEDMPGVHNASKKRVVAFLLADDDARARVEESRRIEEEALRGPVASA